MTIKQQLRQKGFTLIEMIVVLLLVGILTTFAGMFLVRGVQGYLFAKDNAAISEKVQLAMTRINRELLDCYTCSGTSGDVVLPFTNTLGQRYIRKDAQYIVISDGDTTDTLLDHVGTFTMKYNADKSITITIGSLIKPGGSTVPDFVTTVYPRNVLF